MFSLKGEAVLSDQVGRERLCSATRRDNTWITGRRVSVLIREQSNCYSHGASTVAITGCLNSINQSVVHVLNLRINGF